MDSDGDGCYDTYEFGYDDPDNDGIMGTSPVSVTINGMVDSEGPYINGTVDNDDSGNPDFLESGGGITSIVSPDNVVASEGENISFITGGTAISPLAYQWQVSTDNRLSWANTVDGLIYDGSTTTELLIGDVSTLLNGNNYRAIVSTPGFACGDNDTTIVARLIAHPDNDRDGVMDLDDLDDDNDGILDQYEFIDDYDGDGIPNRFDLDSDNDGCNDVIEAGFIDPDGDGLLGNSPVVVDSDGRVISSSGYLLPVDLDGNDVPDYLERGGEVTINTDIVSENEIAEFTDIQISIDASSKSIMNYQWQVSLDDCTTWEDIEDSPDLMITGLLNSDRYTYELVELYAVRDIDNLSDYGIDFSTGNSTAQYEWFNDITSLKAGEYLMIYQRNNWENYFDLSGAIPTYKAEHVNEVNYMGSHGYMNVVLYEKVDGVAKKIDVYGNLDESANNSNWDFEEGWAYRKNGRGSSTTFNMDDWLIREGELDNQGKNYVATNPYPLFKFNSPQLYTGVTNDTLTISTVPITFDNLTTINGSNIKPVIPPKVEIEIAFPRFLPK